MLQRYIIIFHHAFSSNSIRSLVKNWQISSRSYDRSTLLSQKARIAAIPYAPALRASAKLSTDIPPNA
ncbi:hypothetical protein BURPS1106B_0372 [Burkholderia pseudomallei 1106b]|nr:hypothetical protein BURPS1106B_0372 [Burkholderia pseudomallei 1106b]